MAGTRLRQGGSLRRRAGAALAAALVLAGTLVLLGAGAAATTPPRGRAFARVQARVEHRLTERAGELARLVADVNAAATLKPTDTATLSTRLATEQASIAGLAAEASAATTVAQLRAARHTMYVQNRVYGVMVPQVLDAVEASSIVAEVASLEANEASLEASVAALAGQATHRRAARAYRSYVASTSKAARLSSGAQVRVMAQVPANYPRDVPLFRTVSHHLLDAAVAVAHADYDASLVGLAAGGAG